MIKTISLAAVTVPLLLFAGINDAESLIFTLPAAGDKVVKAEIAGKFGRAVAVGDAMRQTPALVFAVNDAQGIQSQIQMVRPQADGSWQRQLELAPGSRVSMTVTPGYLHQYQVSGLDAAGIEVSRALMPKTSAETECYFVRYAANAAPKTVTRGDARVKWTELEPGLAKLEIDGRGQWALDGDNTMIFQNLEAAKNFPGPMQMPILRTLAKAAATRPAKQSGKVLDTAKFAAAPYSGFYLGNDGPLSHAPWLLGHPGEHDAASTLGLLWVLDRPFNPYFNDPTLKEHYLYGEFRYLAKLKSNGTFNFHESFNPYGGGDGLNTLSHYIAFALTAAKLNAAERNLLYSGLAMPVNRFAFGRVSCENQSTHWLLNLYLLYMGSGEKTYLELAQKFCADMADPELNPAQKTGYLEEQHGPDGTYQGLAACNLAFYYRLSSDPNALIILRRIYQLYNHTVAPDGIGCSGYAHRTMGSWQERQWRGGSPLLRGILPEAVAVDVPRGDGTERFAGGAKAYADEWYREPGNARWLHSVENWVSFWGNEYFRQEPLAPAALPAARRDGTTARLGNDFIAYYGKNYYALWYVNDTPQLSKKAPDSPLPDGWSESDSGLITGANRKKGWQPLAGMQLLYFPGYGTAIAAMNWDLYTHNTIRTDSGDRPDISEVKVKFDESANTLMLTQKLRKSAEPVRRTYCYGDNALKVEISAPGAALEQIPYVRRDNDQITVDGDSFTVRNAAGAGYRIKFTGAKTIANRRISRNFGDIGTLEISFDKQLQYTVEPLEKK